MLMHGYVPFAWVAAVSYAVARAESAAADDRYVWIPAVSTQGTLDMSRLWLATQLFWQVVMVANTDEHL